MNRASYIGIVEESVTKQNSGWYSEKNPLADQRILQNFALFIYFTRQQ